MKILDELLQETRTMYEKADAEGLLPSHNEDCAMLQTQLIHLEQSTTGLREITYNATTLLEECMALMGGVSKRIMDTAEKVKKLRGFLLTATEEERRRRDNYRSISGSVSDNASLQVSVPSDVFLPSIDTTLDSVPYSQPVPPSLTARSIENPDASSLSSTVVPNKPRWSFSLTFIRNWVKVFARGKSPESDNTRPV